MIDVFSSLFFRANLFSNISRLDSYKLSNRFNFTEHRILPLTDKSNIADNQISLKKFGPILFNYRNIKRDKDTFIIPSINSYGKPLFIAISCSKNLINVKYNIDWIGWEKPIFHYENELINQICLNQ